MESLFDKVAELNACNFIKKKLQHWCFPVNIAKYAECSGCLDAFGFATDALQSLLIVLKAEFHGK